MAARSVLDWFVLATADLPSRWRKLRLPSKFAFGASIVVLAGMAHLGTIVAGHIRENVLQQSASAAALYMDRFVNQHVQELATNSVLSDESRMVLERLLSPASMHRPVVAFRIWKGDIVAFSNERELIGKTYARTASRERAWQGNVAVEFEQPDGDDDEQVRSLKLPVLEVYAPVRQRDTNRIIALVEIYEIAVDLKQELWVSQLYAWSAIAAITLTVILLLFSMASSEKIERNSLLGRIGQLSQLRAESEMRTHRVSQASLQLCAMNERSLRNVGNELVEGPGQDIALALLKFDALEELANSASGASPSCDVELKEDLEAIRHALNDTLGHIRRVAGEFPPSDIEQLTLRETLVKAVLRHQLQTGVLVDFDCPGIPEQASFPLKASLYRIVLEGLGKTYPATAQRVSVSGDNESRMVVEIIGRCDSQLDIDDGRFQSLRDRIDAAGGQFSVVQTPSGDLSLIVELNFAPGELADG